MTRHPALWLCAALALICLSCTPRVLRQPPAPVSPAPAPKATNAVPKILLLGDSQISFGAGGAYMAFLSTLGAACPDLPDRFARTRPQAIGVRSTALHHWTETTAGPARDTICAVDPTFGVNAGSYGVSGDGLSFVQIGAADYPYCKAGQTPLAAAINHHKPDLVVLAFLGNATDRWQKPGQARSDWRAAERALPPGLPCAVLTTIPAYDRAENDRRQTAQARLATAVDAGGRCSFAPGITPASRAAIEGDAANFRTDDSGTVTDPTHPTAASAARYMAANRAALCAGLAAALTE